MNAENRRISEPKLRTLIGAMLRRDIEPDEPLADVLRELHDHIRMLEARWLTCLSAHAGQHHPGYVEARDYHTVYLLGGGLPFTTVDDLELAVELALDAFYEGRDSAVVDSEGVIGGTDDAARAFTGGGKESSQS